MSANNNYYIIDIVIISSPDASAGLTRLNMSVIVYIDDIVFYPQASNSEFHVKENSEGYPGQFVQGPNPPFDSQKSSTCKYTLIIKNGKKIAAISSVKLDKYLVNINCQPPTVAISEFQNKKANFVSKECMFLVCVLRVG